MAVVDPTEREYREWMNRETVPMLLLSAFFVCTFHIGFHWVMVALDLGVRDSLVTRLVSSIPSILLGPLVAFLPAARRRAVIFHAILALGCMIGTFWVSGLAEFHPFYLSASLLTFVGVTLTFFSPVQIYICYGGSTVALGLFLLVHPVEDPILPVSYYLSFFCIGGALAFGKTLGHRREFFLRKSVEHALADLRVEKSKSFAFAQLSFLGNLAGNVAHEINNPLAILRGQVSRALTKARAASDAEQTTFFEKVDKQAQRIGELVDNLLSFSGGHFNKDQKHELAELTRKAVDLLSLGENSGITIESKLAPGAYYVKGGDSDFMQSLFYLLRNSVEAIQGTTGKKTGRLTIESDFDAASGTLRVRARDDGPGIAPELLPKLFTPFVVGPEKKGHVGMGLSTVSALLEKSGGRVELLSSSAEGACFEIKIPAGKTPPAPSAT